MLNDMTISLLIIGALIIAFVLIYNRWQARKLSTHEQPVNIQNTAEISLQSFNEATLTDELHQQNALSQEPNFEIHLSEPEHKLDPQFERSDNSSEDLSESASTIDNTEQTQAHQSESNSPELEVVSNPEVVAQAEPDQIITSQQPLPQQLSKEIDSIVQFDLSGAQENQPKLVDIISQLLPPAGLQSLLQIFAQTDSGEWHASHEFNPQASYIRLLMALQLVNRDGAISEQDAQQFNQLVDYLQNQLHATAQWLSHSAIMEQAAALDQFCISVDKTLRLHLLHGLSGRFTGTKFRGLAEASGLQLQDGIYVFKGEHDQIAFTVENIEHNPFNPEMLRTVVLKGVSFQLDIPRTAKCAEMFNEMLQVAKRMEQALGGILVDEQQREISDMQLERIRQQLKLIQTQMLTQGIPAGSPLALRLFR